MKRRLAAWLLIVVAHAASAFAEAPANTVTPIEFRRLERRLEIFERMQLYEDDGTFDRKLAVARSLQADYREYAATAPPEWMIAAVFRAGYVMEKLADTIDGGRVPAEVKKLGRQGIGLFRDAQAETTRPFRQEALADYTKAVDHAADFKVKTRWVRVAQESQRRIRRAAHQTCTTDAECGSAHAQCVNGVCSENAAGIDLFQQPGPTGAAFQVP